MFLQTPSFLSPPVEAVLEILLILSLATVLGWLLARLVYARRVNILNDRIGDRQAQLDECRRAASGLVKQTVLETPFHIEPISPVPGINTSIESPVFEVTELVAPTRAMPTTPDDLKIVEGIGPKIEELLNNEGILTFEQLAVTSPERLTQILRAAGPRFQIQDPATWPRQAQLAADGAWGELRKLQEELTAGRG
ncbi:MAG: hypothetical protein H7Y12_07455 [Sphingobacteriaceae bacterium]|nr:hypothetical protein [Cytophagaceae bacterium]